MRRRLIVAVLATAVLGALLAGCGSSSGGGSNGSTASGGGKAAKRPTIAAVLYATGDPYFQQAYCGAKDSAARLGFDLQWQGPAKFDPPGEVQTLSAVAQRKPDAVVLDPADPNAFVAPVRALSAQHVPVVSFDGALAKPVDVQDVRTDGRTAGAEAADQLGALIHGRGTVEIQGAVPGLLTLNDRVAGFKQEIAARFPGITVLPTQYSGGNPAKAASDTQALIKAHPDLNAVYTVVSLDAAPTLTGVRAAGKAGKVTFVSWDATPGNVALLKSGQIAALVAQDPVKTIEAAMKTAYDLATGNVQQAAVDRQVLLPATLITQQNLNDPQVTPLYQTTC